MKALPRWRRPATPHDGLGLDPAAAAADADVVVRATGPAPADALHPVADLDLHLQACWSGGPALATKAATGLLWAALVTGPVALLLATSSTLSAAAPPAAVPAPAADRSGEQAAVSEFAGRYVALWLQSVRGQEAQLAPYVRGERIALPEVGWTAGPPSVADVHRLDDTTWSVVVGLAVTSPPGIRSPSNKTPTAPTRRYFAVPVHRDATGLAALALPAPIAGPAAATQTPRTAYRYRAALNDPLVLSVQQFADALLTGASDVTRLTAPGTAIAPLEPPLYTAVKVTDVATDTELPGNATVPPDGTRLRALVDATATGLPEQRATVQYPLRLAVRGGRWEVTALDPAPALQPRSPTTSPAASTADSGSVPPADGPASTAVPAPAGAISPFPASTAAPRTTPPNPLD